MITFWQAKNGGALHKLETFQKGCWIYALNPPEQEVKQLGEEHHLDWELLQEGLDENELPRLDVEGDSLYLFTKTVNPDSSLETVLFVLGDEFILTVFSKEPRFANDVIAGKHAINTINPLQCLVSFLSFIDENVEKSVHSVLKSVQKKRKDTKKLGEKEIEQLIVQEDFLNNLASSYYYTNLLYGKMLKRIKLRKKEKEILKDL